MNRLPTLPPVFPFGKDVTSAVVVTFYPDDAVIERIEKLLSFFSFVIVVDNTASKHDEGFLIRLTSNGRIVCIVNEENLGIATALNIGVDRAKRMGAYWVATFDQDSVLLCDLTGLIKAHSEIVRRHEGKVIFGASYVDPLFLANTEVSLCCEGVGWVPATELISSGMCFPVNVYDLVGGCDGTFFIDMVDHDLCLKASLEGVALYMTSQPIMVHSVGEKTAHKVLSKRLYASNHSPLRRYYYARNTVVVFKRYLFARPAMAIRHASRMVKTSILVLLFEKEKMRKLFAMLRGVFDGAIGRLGPYRR